MNYKKVQKVLEKNNQPAFRFRQIAKTVFYDGVSSFDEITTISKDLRTILDEELNIYPFSVKEVVISGDRRAIKVLFEFVLIFPKPKVWSACISSQVGCAMSCEFCVTGKLGLGRDLTSDEIVSQVVFW